MASLTQLQTKIKLEEMSEIRFLNLYFWIIYQRKYRNLKNLGNTLLKLPYVENGAALHYFSS